MINILRTLMEKVDNMQRQMGDICKEMEILRKASKRKARDQNTLTEVKNVFDRLISRLDMAERRISEPENM